MGGHPSMRPTWGRRPGQPSHVLALLRVGFAEPPGSPRALVRSYRTVSPLPDPGARPAIGGLFSVALSCGSPRLAVSQHRALWSPDLPRPGHARPRPPGRLTVTARVPGGRRAAYRHCSGDLVVGDAAEAGQLGALRAASGALDLFGRSQLALADVERR